MKPINSMTGAELNEAFAVEVAGTESKRCGDLWYFTNPDKSECRSEILANG